MHQVKVPFIPTREDVKRVVKTQGGGTCYLLDTACKEIGHEEIINRERKVLEAYLQLQDTLALRFAEEVKI